MKKAYGSPKPKTEIELSTLQERLFATRSPEVQKEMFALLNVYTRSLLLKKIKNCVYYEPEKIDAIVLDIVCELMENYQNDPNFIIRSSFAGVINWAIIGRIWGQNAKRIDKEISLNGVIDADNKKELMDITNKIKIEPVFTPTEQYIEKDIINKMNSIYSEIKSIIKDFGEIATEKQALLFRLYVLLYCRRTKRKNTLAEFERLFLTEADKEMIDLGMLEIKNRIFESEIINSSY